jgi:bifunctional N-acetylglucosamine-1-phosphate-uridyltransferase/glucosamine-1-phosphate-acetyltransferase GlmU-like protein
MNQTQPPPIASVILCGGKGKRMRDAARNKVTFPVHGQPAVCRALDVYTQCGIDRHVLVVGNLAGQVVETVGPAHPEAVFAFQPEQRGTGDAARCGVQALLRLGFDGNVLIVAGDKVLQPRAVQRLLQVQAENDADMVFITGPREQHPGSGRVLIDNRNQPQAIVEVADIGKARDSETPIHVAGQDWQADDLEHACNEVNLSVYLFKLDALTHALGQLRDGNAQGEFYLTDALAILAADNARTLRAVCVEHPNDVLAFNSPEELARVEAALEA